MRHFDEIIDMAAARKGGIEALEKLLAATPARRPADIANLSDDRVLSEMSRYVFYAGFSPRVVQAKWPGIEAAFEQFDVGRNAVMDPPRFEALMQTPGIVRNARKIRAVQINARLLLELAASHGSASRFLADWPDGRYSVLLGILKTRGNYLSGHAAMRFLRAIGKPAFVTTADVVSALMRERVVAHAPTNQHDLDTIQAAFNLWSDQSGRNLTEISRILAISLNDTQRPGPRPRRVSTRR